MISMAAIEGKSKNDLWTPDQLVELVDPKNPTLLKEIGQVEGLAKKINSDIHTGLKNDPQVILNQQELYGTNTLPEPVSHTFLQFVWEALHDQTLIVLMVCAAFEVGIGTYEIIAHKDALALIDGGAIIIAILIVVMIGAGSDYRKQAQFRSLNDFGKNLKMIKLTRNGEVTEAKYSDILVGDIIEIQTGVVVPADGVLFQGYNVETDESAMTGEPHAIPKDFINDPFLISGTNVVNGVGKVLVIATGVNSLNGRSLMALEVEAEDTPLQVKLGRLADLIAKFAFYLAISLVLLLLVVYFISNPNEKDSRVISQDMISLLILAVTIVVVAVPEGLPLAVTISLAHATVQMLKDNNLVRHLSACETMGNATTICSDKTGTLTLNKMTVVSAMIMSQEYDKEDSGKIVSNIKECGPGSCKALDLIAKSLNVNSSACMVLDREGKPFMQGSKTEIAILDFFTLLSYPFEKDRDSTEVLDVLPFSSEAKRMSCKIAENLGNDLADAMGIPRASNPEKKQKFIFVKGASEIVLRSCTQVMLKTGKIVPLTKKESERYQELIQSYAEGALRTICAAIKPVLNDADDMQDLKTASDLVLVGLFGILDPLRPEVLDAVAHCKDAGILVRMVTGDSMATARAIAKECGILFGDGIVMEGPDFRKLTEEELNVTLPRLQVLARSSPLDKQILVRNLKRLGETVAVTGDGTNDAPALSSADVGFSMGIAGTEVAKEASDIILMDDNFASLVKAVVWGRCVYDSIRKFLQFQLTVNVSAVVIALITSIYTTVVGDKRPRSALTAVQLLWVNLIMDTLAALALATDSPTFLLLKRKPSKKNEPIISNPMMMMILSQALYQITVCLVVYFMGPIWFPFVKPGREEHKGTPPEGFVTSTLVFNIFIFCQVFNEINCRSIFPSQKNVFDGIEKNGTFWVVMFVTLFFQAIIVQFGNVVFGLDSAGLSGANWGISIALGLGSLIIGFFVRMLPEIEFPVWMRGGALDVISTSEQVVEKPLEAMDSEAVLTPEARWRDAIERVQIASSTSRSPTVFVVPGQPRASPAGTGFSPAPSVSDNRAAENWNILRRYIFTTSAFRRNRRLAQAQMINPRTLHNARQSHALSK